MDIANFVQSLEQFLREIVRDEMAKMNKPAYPEDTMTADANDVPSSVWVETSDVDLGRCQQVDLRSRRCMRPNGHQEQRHRFVEGNVTKGAPAPAKGSWRDRPGLRFDKELEAGGRTIYPGDKIRIDGHLWTFESLAYDIDDPDWERVMVVGRKRGFDIRKLKPMS